MTKRSGFTLMEVNLAVFIMAVGVLAMVALYPLGFRESRQSREDVAGAVLADGILGPLSAALSDTNMTWTAWKQICGGANKKSPANGWIEYCKSTSDYTPKTKSELRSRADQTIDKICSAYTGRGSPKSDIQSAVSSAGSPAYALVAFETAEGTMQLALRISNRAAMLFSQPIYFTEVHFQGLKDQ